MILCVNLNAAIDKTIVLDHFKLGEIHRPQSVLSLAGGKGCNVARVLHTLGQPVVVTGWVGGYAGQFIEAQLRADGIQTTFVHRAEESRMCTSVIDVGNRLITELYEAGAPVQRSEVEQLLTAVKAQLGEAQLLVLSGSLPPGVPNDIYARLIELAHAAQIAVILDASKEALRLGLEAQPTYIKPNQSEMSDLLGVPLENAQSQREASVQVARRYHTTVILSLGKQGALLTDGTRIWQAVPPAVNVVSAVGSGDSLVAGYAAAFVTGIPSPEALRLGVACGTANTLRLGAGRLQAADVEMIRPQVTLIVDSSGTP